MSLRELVSAGDAAAVREYLTTHRDEVDNEDDLDRTCLHVAAALDFPTVAEVLLGAGAFVDALDLENSTPLIVAVTRNSVATAKVLLANGASTSIETSFGATALQLAQELSLHSLTVLLKPPEPEPEPEPDVEPETKLDPEPEPEPQPDPHPAPQPPESTTDEPTPPSATTDPPLPPAVRDDSDTFWGHYEDDTIEDRLFAAMPKPVAGAGGGTTATDDDADADDDDDEDISPDAEPDRGLEFARLTDRQRFHAATARGDILVIQELLKTPYRRNGVARVPDVNCVEDVSGRAAVHFAAAHNQVAVLRELIEQWGAEVDPLDRDLNTPLIVAVVNNNVTSAQYLLQRGADQHLKCLEGKSALQLAEELGLLEAVSVLKGSLPPPVTIPGVLQQHVPMLVEAPQAFPPPGVYNAPLKVVLFSKTSGALIHGTHDAGFASRDYEPMAEPVILDVATTGLGEGTRCVWLRAVAVKEGVGSDAVVFEYRLRSEMSQWWCTLPPYLNVYEDLLKRYGYDTLAKVVHQLPDPMRWRRDLTIMGIHSKFHRGELMRHMRAITSDKWRQYVEKMAPQGPIDVKSAETLEFERAEAAATRKFNEDRKQAQRAREQEPRVPFPRLSRDKVRETVEDVVDSTRFV